MKDLTGDDVIGAAGCAKTSGSTAPTHELMMYGNHKPVVRGDDEDLPGAACDSSRGSS